MTGKIDQVRLFNKGLSSSEVTTLYNETSASATKSTTDIFDDSSGVALYELEGNANDTGGIGGKFGTAAIFNGNGYIAFDGLQTSSNMSVSFWMKTQTTMTTYQMILELSNGYGIVRPGAAANGKIYAQYANSNSAHVASVSTLPVGEWVHVVGTFTSSSSNLYINNVSESGGTISDYLTANQNTIGSRRSDGFFTGSIDDVRIYSDILTTTEIGYLYNNDTANIQTGNLIAYYKLDGNSIDEQGSYDGVDTNVSYAYNGTPTNVTYGYDGTPTNVSFVGTLFQPDLVWIKDRDINYAHQLYDTVRGATEKLHSNTTAAESTDSTGLTAFDSDGFTISTNAGINTNNNDYVAWCWKEGGTAVANTDGSITSSVSANQDAGFSIVSFTGTGSAGSVGHGLSEAPELIIMKNRDGTNGWVVRLSALGNGYLLLQGSGAYSSTAFWGNPTDSVFSFTSNSSGSILNNKHIAYCFHSVDGYQKIGSYSMTSGSAVSVDVGFVPRFVLLKETTRDAGWIIVDNQRNLSGNYKARIYPSSSSAESTGQQIQFIGNTFNINWGSTGNNHNGGTGIYLEIA